jgi:hypothetical protein
MFLLCSSLVCVFQEEEEKISHSKNVGEIDIPTLLDVRTYGDRLLIVFEKGEIRRFIVEICNCEN